MNIKNIIRNWLNVSEKVDVRDIIKQEITKCFKDENSGVNKTVIMHTSNSVRNYMQKETKKEIVIKVGEHVSSERFVDLLVEKINKKQLK